jgi:hypothetical protein
MESKILSEALLSPTAEPSQLVGGGALIVEDLDITLTCHTFYDPIAGAYSKYHGRVSKRRFNKIVKMRWNRIHRSWKSLSPDIRARDVEFESHLESVQRSIAEKLAAPHGVLSGGVSYGIEIQDHRNYNSGSQP